MFTLKTSEYWIVFASLTLGFAVAVGMSAPRTEPSPLSSLDGSNHCAAVAEELSEPVP